MKDKIKGHDPWEIEIAYYVDRGLLDAQVAQWWTIRRYMEFNNLRPLRDAIVNAKRIDDNMVAIDGAILWGLVELIDQGRLEVKQRGKPKSPAKFARDLVGALRFEKRRAEFANSDAAFTAIANELEMPVSALRDAVTWLRKARTEWRTPPNKLTS